MINKILIQLQKPNLDWNSTFSKELVELLKPCTNVKIGNKSILIGDHRLKPLTEILLDENSTYVSFNTSDKKEVKYRTKGLCFGFNVNTEKSGGASSEEFKLLKDNIGEYCEVSIGANKYYQLTISQLLERFKGKIIEVNHAGINFAPSEINDELYKDFKSQIADNCYLVKYPTGEEWPFIIPCTDEEYRNGITNFEDNRNPKFEFVYSDYHEVPVIQFDVQCALSKEEVFRLLPEPYGVSLEGLEDFIRTVFILTDISGLILRFDIRFGKHSGKDFYPWMIKEGGRI